MNTFFLIQRVRGGFAFFVGGVFFLNTVCANLIITEVYYDGTDEWIEISNIEGTDFHGPLTIVGTKSSPINLSNISIPSGTSRIFGDSMSMIADSSQIIASGLAMSISDTSAINLSISSSGETLDTFAISAVDVSTYDNTKTSFARAYNNGILQIMPTCTGSVYNVNSPFIANPGIISSICAIIPIENNLTGSTYTGNIDTGSNLTGDNVGLTGDNVGLTGDIDTGSNLTGDNVGLTGDTTFTGAIITGSILTGDFTNSGDTLSGLSQTQERSTGTLMITEIHAKATGCLDEYLIITSSIAYQGFIDIYGLGISTSAVTIEVSLQTGEYLIIADKTGFVGFENTIVIPSITLTDGGEQLQVLISGQVVDNVDYMGSSQGESFFFTQEQNGVRQFTTLASPSVTFACEDVIGLPTGSIFTTFTGGFGYCDIHVLHSTDIGSGVYSVNLSINGQLSSLCSNDSQWIVNGSSIQSNNCNLTLETIPGIQQIQFIQLSGGVLLCQDEFIINSITNTNLTISTGFVNICPSIGGNNGSNTTYGDDFDCSIRLQNTDMFMFGNSINIVAQTNGIDLVNSSTTYTCSWSGALLTGCNPGYFQYQFPDIYPIDLTVTRNDGRTCRTHTDINYPGDMPISITGSILTGMSCAIRFQNTGPYDIGDSINVITQVDNIDILSTSAYTCTRYNSGDLILTGCNPGYFDYDSSGMYDLNVQIIRNNDGASCSTATTIAVGTSISGGINNNTSDRSCNIRFQNSGPYYSGSSINIVGQVNLTDLSNSTNTYSCVWHTSGAIVLTGCNPDYFSLTTVGNNPIVLQVNKGDGTSCQTQTNIIILTGSNSTSNSSNSHSITISNPIEYTSLSCNIRFQNSGPYQIGKNINVIAQQNQIDIQNSSSSYTCSWSLGNGQTFNQCNPGYFAYTGNGTYQLILYITDKYGQHCQSDQYITIVSGENDIVLGSGNQYPKEFTGNVETMSDIKLKCIMTNPQGLDTNKEKITLTLLTGLSTDLSKYRLKIGSKNRYISGYITYGQDIDIYHSRGFSNTKSGCVSLIYDNTIVDTLCYPTLQEGETYCSGDIILSSQEPTLTTTTTQLEKTKARYEKKLNSLKLSQEKMKLRYEKRIASRDKQIETIRSNYAKYRSKAKERADSITFQLYLYKNYTTLINADLNKNRKTIIDYSDSVKHYMELLQQGKNMIQTKKNQIQIGCQTQPYYKLKDIIKAEQDLGQQYLIQGLKSITPVWYQGILEQSIHSTTGLISDDCLPYPLNTFVGSDRDKQKLLMSIGSHISLKDQKFIKMYVYKDIEKKYNNGHLKKLYSNILFGHNTETNNFNFLQHSGNHAPILSSHIFV